MGLIIGYMFQLGGTEVTFLVRPHTAAKLDRPQKLYSFDEKKTHIFSGYKYLTDPSQVAPAAASAPFDFVLITLDGAALQSVDGLKLVHALGDAVRGTTPPHATKIVLGTCYYNILPWFLATAGLTLDDVTCGALGIYSYPPQSFTLPLQPTADVDTAQLSAADLAYVDHRSAAIWVNDENPDIAKAFVELFDRCGVSRALVRPSAVGNLYLNSVFATFAALDLMGWPASTADIDTSSPVWRLGVAAHKEILRLPMHGPAGVAAAEADGSEAGEGVVATLRDLETLLQPLDFMAFNKFHHGGKVLKQDTQHLKKLLADATAAGHAMPALTELVAQVTAKQSKEAAAEK